MPLDLLTSSLIAGAASVPLAAALTGVSLAPASQFWGPVLSRAQTGLPFYALSFDDGPTPGFTNRILDILADLRVQAAFYVIGVNIERAPDLLRRIHADGHLVGSHTFHHSHYGMFRGPRYWRQQFTRTDDLIQQILGDRPTTFRPPMGIKTPFLHHAAKRARQHVVTWSRRGFDGVSTTPEQILRRLVPTTRPGDILLLHDGIQPNRPRHSPSATVAALRPLILELRNRNLHPRRLDQLLGLTPPTPHPPNT